MASSVLNTPRAIEVGVLVVRTFFKLRQLLATHKELRHKLLELEHHVGDHDGAIRNLIEAIHCLMESPTANTQKKNPIGFVWSSDEAKEGIS